MRRREDDHRVMNACFDAKLLHIACKTVAYNCVNSFVLPHFQSLRFQVCGLKPRGAEKYAVLRAADAGSVPARAFSARKSRMQAGLNSRMGFQI
jgi:hypothetical protein